MLKQITLLAVTYAMLVAQTTVAHRIEWNGIPPQFPLLALIWAISMFRGSGLVIWAGLIGLCSDALGSGPLGYQMASFALVALFSSRLLPKSRSRSAFLTLFTSFLLAAASLTITAAAEVLLVQRPVDPSELLAQLLVSAAYTASLAAMLRLLWNTGLQMIPGIPDRWHTGDSISHGRRLANS